MHLVEHQLIEALSEPDCAVCRLVRDAGRAYLAGVIQGGINDPATRSDWRRRGGLCPRHWRMARGLEVAVLPLAILTEDLLKTALDEGRVRPPRCPACEIEAAAETRYLEALARLDEERLEDALVNGRGFLCLDHLAQLGDPRKRARFRDRLRVIVRDLAEFERKYAYRFAGEPMGPERDAVRRAIRALGGEV